MENVRVRGGRVVQRHVLYLGEINDAQQASWVKTIRVIDSGNQSVEQIALFPSDRTPAVANVEPVKVYLNKLTLSHPRQWGACWLFCELWDLLKLDDFWKTRLVESRKGTRWLNVLKTLVAYRLISPGSEWRLHRQWFQESAIGDLLGEDFSIVQKNTLYRCHDMIVQHKSELFQHLRERWGELFKPSFDVLLYDLTSTYFESPPQNDPNGLRQFGYSRDKRSDCVQVVIALVVTPEGFPLAYEVMSGNTADKTTLRGFLKNIEALHGKANRIWVMDRGVPTEAVLAEMRDSDPPVSYLVGTQRGKLSKLEQSFLEMTWEKVRDQVKVKILKHENEVYVLARSSARIAKERSMRKRLQKQYLARLKELQKMKISRDVLIEKIGAAKSKAGTIHKAFLLNIPSQEDWNKKPGFTLTLNKSLFKKVVRSEGAYLLRSNCTHENPAVLWQQYIQLTEVEQAFKELKNDLEIRPIYHQTDQRIEAHIFISFLAYCVSVTLKNRLKKYASGLTPRATIEKFSSIQMLDVAVPTENGKILSMKRFTQPSKDMQLLLATLKMNLPEQPPPRISSTQKLTSH